MDAELMQWKVASTFQCINVSSNMYANKRKALGMGSMKQGQKKKQPAHTAEHTID